MKYSGERILLFLACLPLTLLALCMPTFAIDPGFDLDTRTLDSKLGPGKKSTTPKRAEKSSHKKEGSRSSSYIVRPGDNLYIILMGRYGLSEKEAEAVIPRLREINGISNIKSLQVGSRITMPLDLTSGKLKEARIRKKSDYGCISQQFKLLNQIRPEKVGDLSAIRGVWDHLLPSKSDRAEGINITGQNFELSLDAERFPVLPAADGGRLLLDPGGNLPPLVKSLVQSLDDVRIVSEDSANIRRFYSSLLSEARFFSVTENFSVDFGNDSQLSISSDFKIEKSPESLVKQELVLLNVTEARSGTPPALASFLSRSGFQLIEPYTPKHRSTGGEGHRIHHITGANASEIADRLMDSLRLKYIRDSKVELFGPNDSGMKLDIMADRYFEINGERFITSRFNGDPVFYTLMRLLETRGYSVIILEDKDDFRRVAEKMLSRLKMPSRFEKQRLWSSSDLPYTVQLPGFMLRDQESGKKIILTGVELDPLISELVTLNGFKVFPPK